MKIVLAIDGSEYSNMAVEKLAKLNFATSSEVKIVSVYENPFLYTKGPIPMGGLPNDFEKELSFAKNAAWNIVKKAVKLLNDNNTKLKITSTVVQGIPKNEILNEAESINADLIVVGSQGHGAVARFLLGSVSQFLAIHANCSVMIVR